jgi:sugar lactone lactonase YvrE
MELKPRAERCSRDPFLASERRSDMGTLELGRISRTVIALAIAAASSACSAGSSAPVGAAAAGGSWVLPNTVVPSKAENSKRILFVSNLVGSIRIYTADIHDQNPSMLGQITQGATRPEGEWIDRKGVLYVVNAEQFPTAANVVEYKRGASSPFRTITDGILSPYAVAVAKDGTVYVNSIGELPSGGTGGMVVVYPPGGLTPKLTITLPEAAEYGMSGGGIALDAQGNVYVANFGNAAVSQFFKIAPGSSRATSLGLAGYGGDAIAIDGGGNLYTGGFSGGSYFVAVYPPGATSPSRTIPLNFEAYGLTVTSNGTLYAVGDDQVAEYAPGANAPTNTVDTLYGETFTYDAAIGSQ